jgi:mannose-1-phosphate guanylyltransferase
MKAILLIGGLGTRLRPLTLTTPKPLLPILDQPFLAYQLDFLVRQGITEVTLCTAYKAEVFHQTMGDGKRYGIKLNYVHEQTPLGTGGAIKNAEPYVDGPTLICNGDCLMNLDLRGLIEFHRTKKAAATLALTYVQDPSAFGVIEMEADGKIRRFLEKPSPGETDSHLINAGAYVFEKEVFSWIPQGEVYSVERGLFPKMLAENKPLYALELKGYWLDVGTLDKYQQAQKDVAEGRYPFKPQLRNEAVK